MGAAVVEGVRAIPPPEQLYFDACATSPLAPEALQAMVEAWQLAWGNPSSLHRFGVGAAECLERSRLQLADDLGADPEEVVWCSGGTEAIQTALLGSAEALEPGRLLISAVEHPATEAAAARLAQRGWQVERLPVDHQGLLRLEAVEPLLSPPTRLVSLIWGQSEVGSLQPVATIGALCRERDIRFHVDAVQVMGHVPITWRSLPVDWLSGAAHKLQGPRGIGVLLARRGIPWVPQIGGLQEGGRRGGTEPVALAAGFAAALRLCCRRLEAHGGEDPVAPLRDALWTALRTEPGVELLGPDPGDRRLRLPHHLSLMVRTDGGSPLPGRALVRALDRRGVACSSGAACSARRMEGGPVGASPVLMAMGYGPVEATGGLRFSFGPWNRSEHVAIAVGRILEAIAEVREANGDLARGR